MTGIVATSYGLNHGHAYAGMVVDGELNNIISKLNVSDVNIRYGAAVVRDGETGARYPADDGVSNEFVGVAVRELNRSYMDGQKFGAVAHKDFSVLTVGVIYVVAAETVAVGDPAFYRVGTDGQGNFAKSAGADDTLAVAIPNAKFVTAGAAGSLVKLSIVVGG